MNVFRFARLSLALLLTCAVFAGCGDGGQSPVDARGGPPHDAEADSSDETNASAEWFTETAAEHGVDFVHTSGDPSDYDMPKSMGSGAAMFDADNDGRLDLFLVQHGQPPFAQTSRFFRQQRDGTFVDATAESGLGLRGRGTGVAAGDVNNDGRTDLLITFYGDARLMLNMGDGKFRDVTEQAGVDNPLWGTSAAMIDFDRDGWLDLLIVNYVSYSASRTCFDPLGRRDFCSPASFAPTVARLFRNTTGDAIKASAVNNANAATVDGAANDADAVTTPTFADVTIEAGLAAKPGPGLGVLCADFDGDHWPDMLIANDGKPNHLWINQHDGTFNDEAPLRGLAYSAMGKAFADMGVAVGDVDRDGLFDLYITHLTHEFHSLWMQESPGLFIDRTARHGLTRPAWRSTGFGTTLADFNHDGWLDLAQVNGRVASLPGPRDPDAPFWQPYVERDQLFAGGPNGAFTDISQRNPAMCGTPNVGRGLTVGDIDNDGDLDLLLSPIDAPAQLLLNVAPKGGHWLSVRAVLPRHGGRDAHGALITLHAGDAQRIALVQPATSYQCSSDPRAHFGLGDIAAIDHIDVRWPDGSLERFAGRAVDQHVTLQQGGGRVVETGGSR